MVDGRYPLADIAALIGEPTRAAMLLALLDGRALPASELARAAQLSAAATSLHLAKLLQGGLLAVRAEGRHRYYRLASEDVGHALEALGALTAAPPPPRALPPERAALRAARTCYDHLAGETAVALVARLVRAGVLCERDDRAYDVSPAGARWFFDVMSIDTESLAAGRRPLARRCLDWTERRSHLAGALGAAVLERFFARRWIARRPGTRALRVTPSGAESIARLGMRER